MRMSVLSMEVLNKRMEELRTKGSETAKLK